MQYMLPRLRGWGESLSRQAGGRVAGGGGIGTRGPGETKIETDRRRIRARVSKLRREIAGMATARDDPARPAATATRCPAWRSPATPTPASPACSTGSPAPGVLVEDALFATLDPTVRRAETPGRPRVHADRHRRLRPAPAAPARRGVPLDAGGGRRRRPAAARRRRLRPRPAGPDRRRARGARRDRRGRRCPSSSWSTRSTPMTEDDVLRAAPGAARRGVGLRAHRRRHRRAARARSPRGCRTRTSTSTCCVPYDRGDLVARVHRDGEVLEEQHEEAGTRLTARVDGALAAALEEFAAPVGVTGPCRARLGRITGRSRARYGDPVTSGAVRRRRRAGARRAAVSVGPAALVADGRSPLLVGVAGHRRPAEPRLARADGPAGLRGRQRLGAARLGGVPARLGGHPARRPGHDPRRPGRAGRLPRLAPAHAGCRWSGCWWPSRLLTLVVYAVK